MELHCAPLFVKTIVRLKAKYFCCLAFGWLNSLDCAEKCNFGQGCIQLLDEWQGLSRSCCPQLACHCLPVLGHAGGVEIGKEVEDLHNSLV